jgi:hypothetical protein
MMGKTLRYVSALGILGAAAAGWATGCSSDKNNASGAKSGSDAGNVADSSPGATADGAGGDGGGQGTDGASSFTYTLIDDMETTTHGPIELDAGITPPETPAYWFNFGASKPEDAGPPLDTADPPLTEFVFTALPTPHTTLNNIVSQHAAHEACSLDQLYDVCGIGVEFAQLPDAGDGGDVDATIEDAGADGDAAPPIPEHTVPFDISAYKGISFWGRTATGADAGGLDVKVLFPDTDTDPRGGVCNSSVARASGPTDLSQCYNSYAEDLTFTGDWQQFFVMFSDLAIDPLFGYQGAQPWSGTNVYGINWQAQDNLMPDAGPQPFDVWIDDVYFIR